MRSRSLVLLLALAGTALSGCASGFDDAYTQSSIPGQPGGNNGTDTGGDGISGDTNGTGEGNEVTVSSGDTTLAYTEGARSTDGSGNTQLVVSATGQSATVSVDPGVAMGFTGTTTMARYIQQTGGQTAPAGFPQYAFDDPNYVSPVQYNEYRRITSTTDSELQVWNFTDSNGDTNYAAHFREAARDQDAWFFGGNGRTDSAELEALAAGNAILDYSGNYAGAATTTGWGDASQYRSADGEWRFNGTASLQANFGSGQFTGTLTPQYWEKFEDGRLIQLDVGVNPALVYFTEDGNAVNRDARDADVRAFHTATVELNGTITGSQISGTTDINNSGTPGDLTNNRFVNGERALEAGVFGSNAEQVTGVFATYGVLPSPTGGDTGINDDRRATIDMQGVFHGQCTSGPC
jgi:hypothetical protein